MPKQNSQSLAKRDAKKRVKRPLNTGSRPEMMPIGQAYAAPEVCFKAVAPSKDADARYRGVDFVGSIQSAVSVTATRYQYIAITNTTLFPRLNAIGKAFVRYRFKKLRIHLLGKSASTQKGVCSFGSIVTDIFGGNIGTTTAATIKNSQGVLTLRGWESGVHEVLVKADALKWLTSDTDSLASGVGAMLGDTFYTIEATTAAGDLAWDIYVEYDVEFTEAWIPTGIDFQTPRAIVAPKSNDEMIKWLTEELQKLKSQTTNC